VTRPAVLTRSPGSVTVTWPSSDRPVTLTPGRWYACVSTDVTCPGAPGGIQPCDLLAAAALAEGGCPGCGGPLEPAELPARSADLVA
jgi:hypothetical protein